MVLLNLLPFDSTRGPDQKEDPTGDSTAVGNRSCNAGPEQGSLRGLALCPLGSLLLLCREPVPADPGALVAQQLGTD